MTRQEVLNELAAVMGNARALQIIWANDDGIVKTAVAIEISAKGLAEAIMNREVEL